MSEDVSNLMLDHLRRIRASQDRMKLDVGDLKLRMSAMGGTLAQIVTLLAGQSARMDRFDERLSRVERRLDLVEV